MRDRLGINLHRDRWPTPPLLKAHEAAGSDLGAPGVDPVKPDLHLAPGRGSVPWTRVARALAAHDAPLMLEVEPAQRPELPALADATLALLARGARPAQAAA